MIHIYHKRNCSTSLSVLKILQASGKKIKVIHYLENPLVKEELEQLLLLLNLPAESLVRKKEKLFQEKFKTKNLKKSDWIKMLVNHPILLERPIVVKGNYAVLARPIEKASEFLLHCYPPKAMQTKP